MQDEVNEKIIAISIKTTAMTAEVLQKSLSYMLQHAKEESSKETVHKGKQTLKQLMEQNAGVSNIEITNNNIRAFESVAKKYGIDYALKRDMSGDVPRYLVFFKGRDSDVITAAFKEFTTKKLKPSIKKVLCENIASYKSKMNTRNKERQIGVEK